MVYCIVLLYCSQVATHPQSLTSSLSFNWRSVHDTIIIICIIINRLLISNLKHCYLTHKVFRLLLHSQLCIGWLICLYEHLQWIINESCTFVSAITRFQSAGGRSKQIHNGCIRAILKPLFSSSFQSINHSRHGIWLVNVAGLAHHRTLNVPLCRLRKKPDWRNVEINSK